MKMEDELLFCERREEKKMWRERKIAFPSIAAQSETMPSPLFK